MSNQTMILAGKQPIPAAERAVWLRKVADLLQSEFIRKYEAGQVEHGGDLGGVPLDMLFDELFRETFDLMAYLSELKRRSLTGGYVIITKATLQQLIDALEHCPESISDTTIAAAITQAKNLISGKATV